MYFKKLSYTTIGAAVVASGVLASCCSPTGGFTEDELALIHGADSIMRVLTIESPEDSLVLRTPCADFTAEALLSTDYERLCSLMVATVTHPSQDGVGIAGPQVGLSRRIVAVQRFDKEPVSWGGRTDYPFEVYPNIKIVWKSDSLAAGSEGCLSVPDRRADVLRSTEIIIEYADITALKAFTDWDYASVSDRDTSSSDSLSVLLSGSSSDSLSGTSSDSDKPGITVSENHIKSRAVKHPGDIPMIRDTVRGFTAVIFQHETDHLDGVLYIDRI